MSLIYFPDSSFKRLKLSYRIENYTVKLIPRVLLKEGISLSFELNILFDIFVVVVEIPG